MSTGSCRWIFLLLFLATWTKYLNSKEIRVVCYYTNWSVYRPGTAKFSPQNINPYLCTHLIYAFGGFTKENTLKPFDKYQDIEKGGYAKFTGLKTYNKNLKTMLAIGGWNEGSSRFSPMVANPDRRKELIKNAIKFLRQNHFDGLDLDWEYPSFRDGGKSRDRDNYAQLVQELREEFERESEKTGRPRLLLTMAVPAGIEYINKGYDVPKLTKYLDWMNILSYDYHSAFEPAVNHHAPLYPLEEPSEYNYDTELNIDYTIQHYLKKGADPNKLVLGIPTYGRSYTLFNPDANEIGAPADGPGDMGEATRENGYLAYYEICDYIKSQDWEEVQPNPDAMGPYAFKGNQWVGYDDDEIARKKAAYVAENSLGGIMFWSIDNDDFRGNCHGKPFPIIEAAKEALISAYGLTDENLVSPPAKPVKSKTRTRTQSSSKTSSENSEKKNSNSGGSRRRNRVKTKPESSTSSSRAKIRRKESRRTTEGTVYSSLELVTPSYTTPAPPPTPGMGGEFKCEDEGFYPHPRDCKKYFWCLSGAGDSGIIAHQFTCPAGLYFNKAADSCDYTRNVLCSKKSKTTTTTTTTVASTSKTPATSTVRVPPKITAATSRTTVFRTSTTTEAYDDEYEYEDEDDEEEDTKQSEEDPRVIKELLDLIKKAGGIEELEKQLKIHEDGSASVSVSDTTTPSSISKSLVERVLGKAAKNKDTRKNSYSFLNRNSRGPQNEGIKSSEDKEKQERGRPQYTTITRQRAAKTTEDDEEGEEDEEKEEKSEDKTSRKYSKKQPEYVSIRRPKVSTTEEPTEDAKIQINRNKILGEDGEDETETDEENEEEPVKKKTAGPQYVNIRRQRPSTTEGPSTSKYVNIRRGTTEATTTDEDPNGKRRGSTTPSSEDENEEKKRGTTASDASTEKNKYKFIRRGSTTESSVDESASTLSPKRRGTTVASSQDVTDRSKTRGTTTATTPISTTAEKYKILKRGSTTEAPTETEDTPNDESTVKYSQRPQLTSTTQAADDNAVTNSETEVPVTVVEHLLITSPESLTIKTTASLSTTILPSEQSKTTKLTEGSDISKGVYQTQTPLLLEPRPFSLSTNGPTSLKPVTETSTRVTKVSEPNYKLRLKQKLSNSQTDKISTTTLTTEKPTPFRTRAPSRFKLTTSSELDHQTTRPTLKPSVRSRKRFSTTTEHYDNYEEYDLNRTYRPSEIADLSSLTAVDIGVLKGINRFNGPSRTRRIRPSSTTTTTEKPEEGLKTSSRTLPLARKLLDGTTFGKSRRIIPSKSETVEDQVNSSSDTTHRIRPFTRAPSTVTVSATTEETTRQTLRNRKVIRRLRPTSSSKLQSQNLDNQVVFKKRLVRPNSAPVATETENLIENASSNSLFNRRLTKPTSTTTKATTTESIQTTTQLPQESDDQNETSEDVSVEEGENIKLSESNIRENSNVNNNNVVNSDDGKKIRRKILKRIKNKVDEEEKITTEPNVVVRTRKIVRKLKPTESTILTSTTESTSPESSTQGRKRKIIRRLRPTTSSASELPATEKTLFIRGRPFTHFNNKNDEQEKISTSEAEPIEAKRDNTKEEEENSSEESLTSFNRNKLRLFAKTTTKSPQSDTSSQRAIDRSKYSVLNRGTTSTTIKYEPNREDDIDEDSEEDDDNDDDDDDDDKEEENEGDTQGRPKYRIYKPTVFHDEEEEEGTTKPRIFHPILSTTDNNKGIFENAVHIKILRPNEEVPESTSKQVPSGSTEESKLAVGNSEVITKPEDNNDTENTTNNAENVSSTESSEQNENKDEEDDENTTDPDHDDEAGITTTTVRNYVNPILSRQKNRPAFVRPKLTTQSPSRPNAITKPKYKSFSRSSTSKPTRIHVVTEEPENNKEAERKFVPKIRTRYLTTSRINRTETTSQGTVEANTEYSVNTTTEFYNVSASTTENHNNTTEEVEITTLPLTTDADIANTTVFDDDENSNTTVTESLKEFTQTTHDVKQDDAFSVENTTASYETDVTFNDTVINENVTDETIVPDMTTVTSLQLTTNKTNSEDVIDETTVSYTDTKTFSLDSTTPESTTIYVSSTERSNENQTTETTPNDRDTSSVDLTVTETTPVYHPKSTLRSIVNRPKYNVPKRLTSTESPKASARTPHKFNQRIKGQTTKSRIVTPNLRSTTPTLVPKNRFLYKYSTTERNRILKEEPELPEYDDEEKEDDIEDDVEEDEEEEEEDDVEEEEAINEKVEDKIYTPRTPSSYTPRTPSSYTPRTPSSHTPRLPHLQKSKPRISNKPNGYSFSKTTEGPKVNEELSDIDTEAVKNRNKNLFSKKRKMNTPFSGHVHDQTDSDKETPTNISTTTAENVTEATPLTTTPEISESVTKPTDVFETTELLTTLHHIFAETELISNNTSTTTESTTTLQRNATNATNAKVEKLIEVNRIVEVHDMNNTKVMKESKVIDKVGVINRVTVVKVVDGNPNPEENEITESTSESTTSSSNNTSDSSGGFEGTVEIATVKEIPNTENKNSLQDIINLAGQSPERSERKFEIYGGSKVTDQTKNQKMAEIIDGRSNINVITPRPYYSTEASTIALEGLFQTDTSQKLNGVNVNLLKLSNDEELLETGNSQFVNVRVPKEEDYITMKAQVVEVTPKTKKDIIKIVPIQVEMSRKLIHPSDFTIRVEDGVPKVNLQILKSENKN